MVVYLTCAFAPLCQMALNLNSFRSSVMVNLYEAQAERSASQQLAVLKVAPRESSRVTLSEGCCVAVL